jgi:DNA-directed RNA polymerase subunit RPC12/RpoP
MQNLHCIVCGKEVESDMHTSYVYCEKHQEIIVER